MNREKLTKEVQLILEPYRDILEGTNSDVALFLERAAVAITNAVISGDQETASEIAGGLKALAWATSVEIQRAHAVTFQRTVLVIIRTAIAALASI